MGYHMERLKEKVKQKEQGLEETKKNQPKPSLQYSGETNRFGMTLVESNTNVPVKDLRFNLHYQRATEKQRKERVKKSMVECGQFLHDQPIIVNQNKEVVDGQHRLLAAIELGYTHVPATIYHFSDPQKEAEFFVHINGFNHKLKTLDLWYGRYLAGDPVAKFIYFLNETPTSRLFGKIVVKGADTHQTRITTTQMLDIILYALHENTGTSTWGQKNDPITTKQLAETDLYELFIRINDFFGWVEDVFGTKKDNPNAYHREAFKAIMLLYRRLKEAGIESQKSTIQKMKSFNMSTVFVAASPAGKKYQLIDHFNKGRIKNKIPYNLEKE